MDPLPFAPKAVPHLTFPPSPQPCAPTEAASTPMTTPPTSQLSRPTLVTALRPSTSATHPRIHLRAHSQTPLRGLPPTLPPTLQRTRPREPQPTLQRTHLQLPLRPPIRILPL